MEYIFGVVKRNGVIVDNLKTVGDTHSNIDGVMHIVREYHDSIIADRCVVLRKYMSDEDCEGNCYDWYIVSGHTKTVDFTPTVDAVKQENEELLNLVGAAVEDTYQGDLEVIENV